MYDPNIHRRKSIRLPEYNYSTEGFYFITICTQEKKCTFGKVVNGEMILNEAGRIVKEEWLQTMNIRKGEVKLHEYVIMPNHFHAIIEICRGVSHTPENININKPTSYSGCNQGVCNTPLQSPSKTVGAIIRGYKGAVSRKIGYSVWQRNYYEHIIRNQHTYDEIEEYILNNPFLWEKDKLYTEQNV